MILLRFGPPLALPSPTFLMHLTQGEKMLNHLENQNTSSRLQALELVEPILHRLYGSLCDIIRTEKLFFYDTSWSEFWAAARPYLLTCGKSGPSKKHPLLEAMLQTLGLQIRIEPEYSALKKYIHEIMPFVPESVSQVTLPPLPSPEGKTALILGVGRDHKTITTLLQQHYRVLAIDKNSSALEELNSLLTQHLNQRQTGLTLIQGSFSDPNFMMNHLACADLICLLHPNDLTSAVTVFNTLKPGGLLITQDRADLTPQFTDILSATDGQEKEFELIWQARETRPVFQTPWSKINPTGNVVNMIKRSEHSTLSRNIFLKVPERTRRLWNEKSKRGFSQLSWLTDVIVEAIH